MKRHPVAGKKGECQPGICCRGRVWIERDGETFLGFGRVVLLERIREHGSISSAARSMDMSYKHAWDLVDSMNRQAGRPLVVTSRGGRGGGGARLTEEGERAVAAFHRLHGHLISFLERETAAMEKMFL